MRSTSSTLGASWRLAGDHPTVGFTDLAHLGSAAAGACTPSTTSGCLIDYFLATNGAGKGKDGFSFGVTGASLTGYVSNADALTINQTGTRSFCSDETGVIYFKAGANGCLPTADVPLQ